MRETPARASRSIVAVQTTCTPTFFKNYYSVMFISLPTRSCKNNSQSVVYATDSNEINIGLNYYTSLIYSNVFTFYEEPINDVKKH